LQTISESYWQGDHPHSTQLIQSHQGTGQHLPPALRAIMERHFDRSLCQVRVHHDAFAAQAAASIDANAFTVGNHIFFSHGMYSPNQPKGRIRLAHELAHTLQQQGTGSVSESQVAQLEQQAEQAALRGTAPGDLSRVGLMILREPTYPRRATGNQIILEAERVLTTTPDPNAADETTRKWSNVASNFSSPITAGSIARRVWTHVFLRHFVEPDPQPGVESRHPRYFYSHTYGWIDGQHFFGFIDFAEQQYQKSGGKPQEAFDAATQEGLEIEQNQQKVRDKVILGRPPSTDPTLRLMQVRPPNTSLFRSPQMVAQAAVGQAALLYAFVNLKLTGKVAQSEVFGQLNAQQQQKFLTDSAKSAFTYEDFQSNQLGTRFFFEYGIKINQMATSAREVAFRSALTSFFKSINIENDPKKVEQLAASLPGKERFEAPKVTEAEVRQKHPELFKLP
jgi:hypothetical protein